MRRLALVVSLVALLLAGQAPAAAQTEGPVYVVQAGDTLFAIARQFGLPLEVLQAANPTVNAAALQIGQSLIIPGYAGVSGTLTTHLLEPGESLDSLALRFGLPRDTLVRLNRLVNPGLLYISQPVVLVEPTASAVPAGVTLTAGGAEGLLAVAARAGANPWALAAANRLAGLAHALPGASVVVPGGAAPVKALPAPLADIAVRPLPLEQGRTLVLRVTTTRPGNLAGQLGEWPLSFHPDPAEPSSQVGLLGLYRLAEPNLYPLTLTFTDGQGQVAFSQALPIRAGQYGSDPPLTVDPVTLDPAVIQPEFEKVRAVITQASPERLWTGPFALPSVGVIRSRFGALRAYNGGPYDSFHGGVDFSGGDDRPITAPAPGVVVLAEALTVRGNATILDHGWGVFTGYWHQSAILVQVGQRVATGELIGYQGSTGRVTGPHLHWEVFVGGYQVEPLEWTEATFP